MFGFDLWRLRLYVFFSSSGYLPPGFVEDVGDVENLSYTVWALRRFGFSRFVYILRCLTAWTICTDLAVFDSLDHLYES